MLVTERVVGARDWEWVDEAAKWTPPAGVFTTDSEVLVVLRA